MKKLAMLSLVLTWFVMVSTVLHAATWEVNNSEMLVSRLKMAATGDVVFAVSGGMGFSTGPNIKGVTKSGYVTVKAPAGIKFGQIIIENSSYIRIDGVRSSSVDFRGTGHHIEILNCNLGGTIGQYTSGCTACIKYGGYSNVTMEGNYFHNAINGTKLVDVKDLVFKENRADSVSGDSYKFSNITDGLIENNFGARYYYPQPDAHHDFMQWQGSVSKNVILRGNVSLIGKYGVSAQGIFGGNPTYVNFTVENNIIYTAHANGISLPTGSGNTVRNNTVLVFPGQKRTGISVAGAVLSNNVTGVGTRPGLAGVSGTNHTIQCDDAKLSYYYNTYYKNGAIGAGCTIKDLTPVAGSPAAAKVGAYARIYELLNGGSGTGISIWVPEYTVEPGIAIDRDWTEMAGVRFLDITGRQVTRLGTGYFFVQTEDNIVYQVLKIK
jgi:parallel beta-helix repeat protein